MNPATILRFQVGSRDAILTTACSRAAFWTGMVLVLITAVPRNYDQLSISENPWRWLFGPLAFSLISGTWTYLVAYLAGTSAGIRRSGGRRQSRLSDWMAFMGLFWLTAPIAWLYAIPVERFLDPVAAAQANVTLLTIVAAWRVVLMARILQVACQWRFGRALSWVLAAASAEMFALGFFGDAFGRALMAGMGGMRMSPAEDVITTAFANAMLFAVPVFVLSAAVALGYGTRGNVRPLPERLQGTVPWLALAAAAILWAAIAIRPQLQVENNAKLDRLVAAGHFDQAVAFLDSRNPGDFSPSRELAPKAYERRIYTELPAMIAAADPGAAPWVWDLLLRKLDVVVDHLQVLWMRDPSAAGFPWKEVMAAVSEVPAGRAWLGTHKAEIAEILRYIAGSGIRIDETVQLQHEEALLILETNWGVAPDEAAQ